MDKLESARLAALESTSLLDSPPERAFDRVTELVCRALRVPVSTVSLVDRDRQFFKSQQGVNEPWATLRQTPLSHSFCRLVVASGAPLVIPDSQRDPLVCDNPAVAQLGVQAYLGVPLRTRDGFVLGSLCAINNSPREWTSDDLRILEDLAHCITNEIELREQLRLRDMTEARLSLAMQSGQLGVWDWDVHSGFLALDLRCQQIHGLEDEPRPPLSTFLARIHQEDRPRVKESLAAFAGIENQNCEFDYRVLEPDNSVRWVHARCGTFLPNELRPRVLGLSQDVTRQKLAELETKRANQDLEQFACAASHDLQEPLRTVNAFLHLLERDYSEKLDGTGLEYIRFAGEGARRMHRLIRDLLDYSRASSSRVFLRRISLQDAFEAALHNLAGGIHESQATITAAPLPNLLGDSAQLVRVLQNLLGNALKYRRDGHSPHVHVTAEPWSNHWLIRVTDDGIGIAPQNFDRIFGLFQRLHGIDEPNFSGTGIGLTVCQRIVERHGGRIWVESAGPNQGATFCFTLQKAEMRPQAVAAHAG